ncbi:MAG: MBL fold metallo-hydrolase [Bacteroidales bacterium]|nr:MBL fold metallo-hydrolase [Bacteroidales bacterium]
MTRITKVKTGQTNSYLVHTPDGYILVDTGTANQTKKVERALNNAGADIKEIKLIIVTHAHYDHVGSLQEIKIKSGASVLVHEKEKRLLQAGKTDFPAGTFFMTKLLASAGNSFMQGKFNPVDADITITDKYSLQDFGIDGEVIHTPGHTEGSISVLIEGEHLICGDTFFNVLPNSVYPVFANDQAQLLETWKKIEQLNCKTFYPGHGNIFNNQKYLKTLKRKIR